MEKMEKERGGDWSGKNGSGRAESCVCVGEWQDAMGVEVWKGEGAVTTLQPRHTCGNGSQVTLMSHVSLHGRVRGKQNTAEIWSHELKKNDCTFLSAKPSPPTTPPVITVSRKHRFYWKFKMTLWAKVNDTKLKQSCIILSNTREKTKSCTTIMQFPHSSCGLLRCFFYLFSLAW